MPVLATVQSCKIFVTQSRLQRLMAVLSLVRTCLLPFHNLLNNSAASGLPRRILILHGALTMLVPYAHSRFRAHALSRAWPDAPTSDLRRKAWDLLTSFESSYTLLSLVSFVAFLWDGRYVSHPSQ